MVSTPPLATRTAIGLAVLLLAGFALPSTAAAQVEEKFEVLSVNTVGCNSGNFGMTVRRSNLDADGGYIVRTRLQVGAQLYMNEHATISVNGESGWSVFDNFTYGLVPNRGAYPIPVGMMNLDFSLERPKGVVLSTWRLIVDGCATGGILYNAGRILVDGFESDGTSRWSSTVL